MADRIEIHGIRAIGRHGVLAEERQSGQPFIADVVLHVADTTVSRAAASDDLSETVDYSVVAQSVHAMLAGEPVDLLETLAESIARACLAIPAVKVVELSLHKPQAPVGVHVDDVVVRITRSKSRAALGIGSNLGDRMANLQAAVDALASTEGIAIVALSDVYETAPVGGPDQDDFLNAVVVVDTVLAPLDLLDVCLSIEERSGRVREVRWGPRTLDVDVLAIDDLRVNDERLMLPHPRAAERAFVLAPWADVEPGRLVAGATIDLHLAKADSSGVERRSDLNLSWPGRAS